MNEFLLWFLIKRTQLGDDGVSGQAVMFLLHMVGM